VACEVGEGLGGRRGLKAALTLCLVASGLLAALVTMFLSWHLNFRLNPRYTLYLLHFSVLLLFAFLLWLRTFRALWLGFSPGAPGTSRRRA
jgi:hypothetical protein